MGRAGIEPMSSGSTSYHPTVNTRPWLLLHNFSMEVLLLEVLKEYLNLKAIFIFSEHVAWANNIQVEGSGFKSCWKTSVLIKGLTSKAKMVFHL